MNLLRTRPDGTFTVGCSSRDTAVFAQSILADALIRDGVAHDLAMRRARPSKPARREKLHRNGADLIVANDGSATRIAKSAKRGLRTGCWT
jgi:hypothetical protein